MKRVIFTLLFAATALCGCVGGATEQLTVETPDQAVEALKAGNLRYVTGKAINPRADEVRRDETLNTQNPYAAIIACSDSRVPVEVLFDQGIGDLFVIRTAGNSVNSDVVMGSVDYAIDHLNVPLVVILGHQNCGGVTSTITVSNDDDHHHHNGKIGELLEVIRGDVEGYVGHPEKLDEAIMANADAQVDRIKSVDYIQERLNNGKLKVVSAYYNLETGEVEW